MSYSLKISGSNEDLSDYIIDIGEVPMLEQNDDYSIIASEYNFSILKTCPDISLVDLGTEVLFYSSSVLINHSIITDRKLDYSTDLYDITAINKFTKLKELTCNSFYFSASLSDKIETMRIFDIDRSYVTMKSIYESIFSMLTCSLDWTTYYNTSSNLATVTTYDFNYSATGSYSTGSLENLFYFIPEQIASVNQNGAYKRNSITGDLINNELPLFDLLSHMNGMVGFSFAVKNPNEYYVINNSASYSGIDQYYFNEYKELKKGVVKINYSTMKLYPSNYFFPASSEQSIYYTTDATDPADFVAYEFKGYDPGNNYYSPTYYSNFTPFITNYRPAVSTSYADCVYPFHADFGICKYLYFAYEVDKIRTIFRTKTTNIIGDLRSINKIAFDPIANEAIINQFRRA